MIFILNNQISNIIYYCSVRIYAKADVISAGVCMIIAGKLK